MMPPVEHHPLQPFLPAQARVLMLGSFPPQRKRWCMDFYYPNYNNDMWRIVGLIFFNDAQHFVDADNKSYRKALIVDFLEQRGIAIYDTACAVRRLQDNASDRYLEVVTPTDITKLLSRIPQCRTLITTGQKATDTLCDLYHITQPKIGQKADFLVETVPHTLYRMPSTSRAYPLSLAKKAEAYRQAFAPLLD